MHHEMGRVNLPDLTRSSASGQPYARQCFVSKRAPGNGQFDLKFWVNDQFTRRCCENAALASEQDVAIGLVYRVKPSKKPSRDMK